MTPSDAPASGARRSMGNVEARAERMEIRMRGLKCMVSEFFWTLAVLLERVEGVFLKLNEDVDERNIGDEDDADER